MKIKELLQKLATVNPEAEVQVVVNNYPQLFSLAFGNAEGCTQENCTTFSFYVDSMCDQAGVFHGLAGSERPEK